MVNSGDVPKMLKWGKFLATKGRHSTPNTEWAGLCTTAPREWQLRGKTRIYLQNRSTCTSLHIEGINSVRALNETGELCH